MTKFKLLLLGMFLFCCDSNSHSSSQTDSNPEQIIHKFFEIYNSDGSNTALDYILSTNNWIEEGSIELKKSVNDLISQIGPYYGNELIAKRGIGDNYILWSFMIKHERQPIRFQFIFYKPSNKWQLQDFRYDDGLDTELIEAASAYRLKENLPGND